MKNIMGVIVSFTLLTNCSTHLIVDTKGQSGTFNKSTAHELTDDRILCNQIVKDNVNGAFDNTKFLYTKYIEIATLGLVKAKERKATKINRNCLKQRGHSVLN
tara:strand:- start:108 stop:416 length:309 start_codon:yes stop_codon:yes gene_type:complete